MATRTDGDAGHERRVDHLFLYGTLMRGQPAHLRFALATRLAYAGDATIAGRLCDLGGHPGLLPGSGRVDGEVHRILDPALLAELDAYEGFDAGDETASDYLRRTVFLPGFGVEAWVYLYNGPLHDATPVTTSRWR